VEVDFTDQETYECLFKEYWEDLKQRLSLTPEELDKDRKSAGTAAFLEAGSDGEDKLENQDYLSDDEQEADEQEEDDDEMGTAEVVKKKTKRRRKPKAQLPEGEDGDTDFGSDNNDDAMELSDDNAHQDEDEKPTVRPREFDGGWASKELIEFVKYMGEDAKKPLSRFQVTKLLWSYIKSQKLQDPRKKAQIVCDDRLRTIFDKKTVGQFEMFKHLQSHFAPKGRGRGGRQIREDQVGMDEDGTDPDDIASDDRVNRNNVKDRRRKKKSEDDKFERPNLNEYAAVTPKNIGLIYLRRQLLEELLDDPDFDSKVCYTFVRIRVPGMISKSEMCYRLVQVVGKRLPRWKFAYQAYQSASVIASSVFSTSCIWDCAK
jgi:chromatin remodeling complex protein RSC6